MISNDLCPPPKDGHTTQDSDRPSEPGQDSTSDTDLQEAAPVDPAAEIKRVREVAR